MHQPCSIAIWPAVVDLALTTASLRVPGPTTIGARSRDVFAGPMPKVLLGSVFRGIRTIPRWSGQTNGLIMGCVVATTGPALSATGAAVEPAIRDHWPPLDLDQAVRAARVIAPPIRRSHRPAIPSQAPTRLRRTLQSNITAHCVRFVLE